MPDFRVIPSIEQLRRRTIVATLETQFGDAATVAALRASAGELRAAIATDDAVPGDGEGAAQWIEQRTAERLGGLFAGTLRPVINATGVIVHTNLGRAPLSALALRRMLTIAGGYSNLEYDVDAGARGSRTVHAEQLLTALTGAEAAIVVNNNAAATLLLLTALAERREVVVSRGELVEIGGGFRVPDVMAASGALLREVGTTNRTRIADYRAAIAAHTALLLRVHPSNFRIDGFTERPTLNDLVTLGREAAVPVAEDLGSGSLLAAWSWEPTVQASIAAGVDLVCFSGDKLLGGPQAGIIIGRRALIATLARHPLMRALRVDKLTLAALEGTLLDYLGGRAPARVPVAMMIELPLETIRARAQALASRLHEAGWDTALIDGASTIGGGSAPGLEIATVLVAIALPGRSAAAVESLLRSLDPPIIARIAEDRVVLDLRTVPEALDDQITRRLEEIW